MLDRLQDAFSRQREFVSDASHELRTPLTAIRGQLEVLARQEHPDADEVRRVEGLVRVELGRMERLVSDLLMLARLDEGAELHYQQLDPSLYLRELLDDPTVGAGVELDEVPPGTLRADPDRIAQVVRNLLRNAREHAGPAGQVRVSARAVGGRIAIEVSDDGAGIPAAQRDRIFDRFHRVGISRAWARLGGAGLGWLSPERSSRSCMAAVDLGPPGGLPAGGARITFEVPGFTARASSSSRTRCVEAS